jgi:MoaA/NifB/PqqE/SkfB family radical SAM enzyme
MFFKKLLKLVDLFIHEPSPTIHRLYLLSERRILKNSKTLCGPVIVKINTGYKCNLHCPLCPTGRKEKSNSEELTLQDAEFIVTRIGKAHRISLFGWGESFLNKDIFKIIELLKILKKHISIDSNLNIVNEKVLENITKSKIDILSVSLDGVNQKSYELYRYGGSFDLAFQNMVKLKRHSDGPRKIQWQYLISRKNIESVEQAKKMANRFGIPIVFYDIGMYLDIFVQPSKELELEWRTEDQVKRMELFCRRDEICKYMYNDPFVDPDGRVYPCCNAARAPATLIDNGYQNVFGNLHKNSLFEIWNNEYYQYVRSKFSGRHYKGKEVKPICLMCKVYLDSKGVKSI